MKKTSEEYERLALEAIDVGEMIVQHVGDVRTEGGARSQFLLAEALIYSGLAQAAATLETAAATHTHRNPRS